VIVGGSGNSLDRNYHYSAEENVDSIAERTFNTNVGFINLFKRHNKPWMNGKIRSVNLWFDRALMGHGLTLVSLTLPLFQGMNIQHMACTIILEAKGGLHILLLKE
jgi:hypothetical protein